MKTERLENCFAYHEIKNGVRSAIFVNSKGEEVRAITDEDTEADYCDWLETEYYDEFDEEFPQEDSA